MLGVGDLQSAGSRGGELSTVIDWELMMPWQTLEHRVWGRLFLCSVPTRGCIWHPFQEQGWDFEECVDRLLLQQTANQTASNDRLCVAAA